MQHHESYAKSSQQFFREFEQLRDALQGSTARTILPYVAPVYNHIASQGYQQNIHFDPLLKGLFAFCAKEAIPTWKAPPDQYDRSVSPTIPPAKSVPVKTPQPKPVPAKKSAAPIQPKPVKSTKPIKSGPSKETTSAPDTKSAPTKVANPPAAGKGKGKMKKLEEADEASGSEFEPEETGEKDVLDLHPVPCEGCAGGKKPCIVNPTTVGKENPACLQCFSWKLKCSLRARAKDEEEEPDLESKTTGKGKKARAPCKKMPAPVSGGEPGEYGGKSFVAMFIFSVNLLYSKQSSQECPRPV